MINMMPLKRVCSDIIDCPHESPEWLSAGTPVIRNFNLVDGQIDLSEAYYVDEKTYIKRTRRATPSGGDIIFSREAPIGNCAIVPQGFKCCLGQRLVLLRVNREICSPEYLLAALLSDFVKMQILQVEKSGSIVSNFNIGDLEDLVIPVIDSQETVASISDMLNKKLLLNKNASTALESMAKTLYDYWFTQFDFPNADGKPYRSSGGAMEWNEKLKREIPKGWRCSVIANHIGDSKGGDWGKDTLTGNYQKEVVCIRGADFPSINGGKTLNAPVRYILSKNANKTLLAGDIIVEISGGSPTQSTGRICYINDYTLRRFDKEIITSNFCKAFSTKKASEQYWLYLLWKTLYDAGVLFGFEGKTTGIKNLLFDDFCVQYRIVAPDNTVLQRFHETVSPIFEKIQQYNIENDELTKLRDWLLPMLMNGQATVE